MFFTYYGGSGCHPGRQAMRGAFGRHGWHGRGFGGGRGERSGGRSRRMFDGGELRLVLLKLIADEPRHGYDLIREIERLTGGAYAPSPGVVYPTLTMLDEMGLIEASASDGAKKAFAATDAGKAELDANADEVTALIARLEAIGTERSKTDATSIRRAMGNLREVLVNRLNAGEVDDAVLDQMIVLLDETARRIERL